MVKSLFDTNVLIDYLDAVPQAQDELTRYRKLRGHTSAAVLLGTGAGIAFFMLVAHRTGNATAVAAVARIVLSADFVFTTKAGTVQPITGIALARKGGYSLWDWRIFGRSSCIWSRAFLAAGRLDADEDAQYCTESGGDQ